MAGRPSGNFTPTELKGKYSESISSTMEAAGIPGTIYPISPKSTYYF